MQPELSLSLDTVTENARAWRAHAGGALYAVVKGDGYRWGVGRMVRALESVADAYCVADAQELGELRRHTQKRAIILGSVQPGELADVLRWNATPTIGSVTEFEITRTVLEQLGVPLRVRIGIRPAAGFSGLSSEELRGFAPGLAAARAEVELWTHVTDWDRRTEQTQTFENAVRFLLEIGARVVSTDIASTFPLAADGPHGNAVRVGVGLFGATGGPKVSGVRCALRVIAPVVRVERHSPGTRLGYGGTMLRMGETIATARCGYADGLPKDLAGTDDILSVGMQYVTARASRLDDTASELVLLDGSSDLDMFASNSGRLPHEIVTSFGNCARASGVSVEV